MSLTIQPASSAPGGRRALSVYGPTRLCNDPAWCDLTNVVVVALHHVEDSPRISDLMPVRQSPWGVFIWPTAGDRVDHLRIELESSDGNVFPAFKPGEARDNQARGGLFRTTETVWTSAFRIEPTTQQTLSLVARLQLHALTLAEVEIVLEVGDNASRLVGGSTAPALERIFVSYSRRDLLIVEMVDSILNVIGSSELFWDLKVLKSGEKWARRLREEIRQADRFQLFWSRNAKESTQVDREVQYALDLDREGFVSPVYWEEPMPEPPKHLEGLHFERLKIPAALSTTGERTPMVRVGRDRDGALSDDATLARPSGVETRDEPNAPARAPAADDDSLASVRFVGSGVEATTDGTSTILQLAREHGVHIDSGCEQGECGKCVVPCRSGRVVQIIADSSVEVLRPGNIHTCSSFPLTDIEIDA